MKKFTSSNRVTGLAIIALVVALAGCATQSYQKGASASLGLTDTANMIAGSNTKIDATLAVLNGMVANPQGDLVAKFKTFNSAVKDLMSAGASVSAGVNHLGTVSADYFKAWDEQLKLIQDPDIKKASSQRKAEVERQFADIKQSFAGVDAAFKPFMSYLKDIQLALGTDLNAAGVASIKDAVEKAGGKAQDLKVSVDKLASQFRELGIALATKTPVPAPPAPAAPTAPPAPPAPAEPPPT